MTQAPRPLLSGRAYVRLAPRDEALFRFLLESYDNLGTATVIDRKAAVLLVRFAPGDERRARAALTQMAETIALEFLPVGLFEPKKGD